MGTCEQCLDGRHTRCLRDGCPCNICHMPKAKARVKAVAKAHKQKVDKPRGGDGGSTKPLTKEEGDELCEAVVKLLEGIRLRQIRLTAEDVLREELRAMALGRADAVADLLLDKPLKM